MNRPELTAAGLFTASIFFAAPMVAFAGDGLGDDDIRVRCGSGSPRRHDRPRDGSSGAAVANAEVRATNAATGVAASGRTSGAGVFSIPFLLPGTYSVTVELPGFRKFVRENIQIRVSETIEVNVRWKSALSSKPWRFARKPRCSRRRGRRSAMSSTSVVSRSCRSSPAILWSWPCWRRGRRRHALHLEAGVLVSPGDDRGQRRIEQRIPDRRRVEHLCRSRQRPFTLRVRSSGDRRFASSKCRRPPTMPASVIRLAASST